MRCHDGVRAPCRIWFRQLRHSVCMCRSSWDSLSDAFTSKCVPTPEREVVLALAPQGAMTRYLGWGQLPMTVHVPSATGRTLMFDVVRPNAVQAGRRVTDQTCQPNSEQIAHRAVPTVKPVR